VDADTGRAVARFAVRASAAAVVAVAGAALVLGVVVPRVAGATPYVVLTDSMTPALPVGTLVVSRPVEPEEIATSTVITYQLRSGEEQLVTHRVVGLGTSAGGERVYVTQGDANEVPDIRPVRDVQVRGALWYHVPYLGHVAGAFTGGRQAVGGAVAVLLLGYAAWQLVRAARERSGRTGAVVAGPGETGSERAREAGPVGRAGPFDRAGPGLGTGPGRRTVRAVSDGRETGGGR
jgi:signal peptidase